MAHLTTKRTLDELRDAAFALEPQVRAELAHEILATLGTAEVSPEFALDLERRIHDVDSGSVKAISWLQLRHELKTLARNG